MSSVPDRARNPLSLSLASPTLHSTPWLCLAVCRKWRGEWFVDASPFCSMQQLSIVPPPPPPPPLDAIIFSTAPHHHRLSPAPLITFQFSAGTPIAVKMLVCQHLSPEVIDEFRSEVSQGRVGGGAGCPESTQMGHRVCA